MYQRTSWILAVTAALIAEAGAQQFVYPAKGQSPQQQKSDEAACYSWRVEQSGFDPAKPQPQQQAAAPPTTATGTTPGAGARGAARGAIVGEVVGGDAGAGAAAGATAGRAQSRRKSPPRPSRLSNNNRRVRKSSRRPSARRAPRVWKAGDTLSSE